MRRWGFRDLHGIDPFTKSEVREQTLTVKRMELHDVRQTYDVIMFNHVLEHLANPLVALREARDRLKENGAILVRIPIAASFAARTYRGDWFNLDAPRHLTIPSRAGMLMLSHRAELETVHEEFDSTEKSLIMSERYRRDIPMTDSRELKDDPKITPTRVKKLNDYRDGDTGVYVLKRRTPAGG